MKRLWALLALLILMAGLVGPVAAQKPTETAQQGDAVTTTGASAGDQPGAPSSAPVALWPGPDGYGYSGATVPYSWIDISTSGTVIPISGDDSSSAALPIGFTFNFYGTGYTTFYVQTNGTMAFGASTTVYSNQCPLPNATTPNNIIAVVWDDLNMDANAWARYQTFGTCPTGPAQQCLVSTWANMDTLGGSTAGTWQVILYAGGEIRIQFQDVGTAAGGSSTTGIEGNNAPANFGLTYACNTASSIAPNTAIRFFQPPFDLSPDALDITGCVDCEWQNHVFAVANRSGMETMVDLAYSITGPGQVQGPASVGPLADGAVVTFTVNVMFDALVPPGSVIDVRIDAHAVAPDLYDTSTIHKVASTGFWANAWVGQPIAGAQTLYWGHSYFDGQLICYVGGLQSTTLVSNVHQCFDPTTQTWSTRAALPTPVFSAAYGFIGGKFYVAGGFLNTSFVGTDLLQIYDVATDAWSTGASLPTARGGQAGGVVAGKLYSAGGSGSSSFPFDCPTYEYDPVGNTWATRATCPLQGGYGLDLGGSVGSDFHGRFFAGGHFGAYYGWYAFDPVGNTWQTLANLPYHKTPLMVEDPTTGLIYSVGGMIGWAGNADVRVYDYGTNTWDASPPNLIVAQGGSLGPAHGSFGGSTVQGLWTFGGTVGSGPITPAPHEFLEFNQCDPLACVELNPSKVAPPTAPVGAVITYTIVLDSNLLPPLPGTMMVDPLPPGVAYADNLTWTMGTAWYSPTANTVFWTSNPPPMCTVAIAPGGPDETPQLQATLDEFGYNTVVVNTVQEARDAGANVIIDRFDTTTFPVGDVDGWLADGRGYVQMGDWPQWFASAWEGAPAGTPLALTVADPGHPLTQGLPGSWSGLGFYAYGWPGSNAVGWALDAGYPNLIEGSYGAPHQRSLTGADVGPGRAVYIGFNTYGSLAGAEDVLVLHNALTWSGRCGGGAEASLPAHTSGAAGPNPGLTPSSPSRPVEAVPSTPANPTAVLWDQPLSTVNQNAYVDQDFPDFPTFSSFLFDDFDNADPWALSTIFVPGDGWNGFSTLMNASSLTWAIYADDGSGLPVGYPGGGSPPFWSITLPPNDPQVVLSNGTPGGMPSNTQLNLVAPPIIPPGHWWLVFYPTMSYGSYGQYGRQPADTTNGYLGKFINPGGGFGFGSGFLDWTILGATQHDIAFRLEGEIPLIEPPRITFNVTLTAPCDTTVVNEGIVQIGHVSATFAAATLVTGDPDIEVTAPPLFAELCPTSTAVITFTICNAGDCDLLWSISEQTGTMALAPKPAVPAAPRPVELKLDAVPGNGPASAWTPHGPVALVVDDGSAENFIGLNDGTFGYQFLWLNRFTPAPADFPFTLSQVSVVLGSTGVSVGDPIELVVYADPDGDGDPSNATLLATFAAAVQYNDGVTWNVYDLPAPIALAGPGDVLIGVINRYEVSGVDLADFPAALDTGASQQRSWVASWSTDPPEPPILPPDDLWGLIDDFGFAGNWLIRGAGETIAPPVDIPWVSESPMTGTVPPGECTVVDVTFDSTGLPPGDYFADLVINSNDPEEPVVTLPVTMTVDAPALADFNSNTPVCLGQDAVFTNGSSGTEPITYLWTFGDGGTSTETNPIHVYTATGTYDVSLLAENACGSSTAVQAFVVNPVAVASFDYNPASGVVPLTVYFTDTSTAAISPTWTFGDGGSGSGANVQHTYTAVGDYTVTLTVESPYGCGTSTATHLVHVSPACEEPSGVEFTWAPTSPLVGEATRFTGTVAAGTMPFFYTWDFGDGSGATGSAIVSYIYSNAGSFTVTLTVTNTCGLASMSHPIVVRPAVVTYSIYLPIIFKGATR